MWFHHVVTASEPLAIDLAAAHAMILAERAARLQAEAAAAKAQADLSSIEALIGVSSSRSRSCVAKLGFADVLAWIANLRQGRLHELLPWNWSAHVRSVASPQAA
jgi:hypothetical protein